MLLNATKQARTPSFQYWVRSQRNLQKVQHRLKLIRIITYFTKYSNNLLSYPVRYCSCFQTHSGQLVHRYRTDHAPISARSRSSIKMAERLIKPQHQQRLHHLTKIKAQKAIKDCVCKQIIWLYYGTSELKDDNNISASYDGKQEEEKIVDQTWLYGKKKIFSAIRQQ